MRSFLRTKDIVGSLAELVVAEEAPLSRQEEEILFSWSTPENLCLPFQRSHFCPSGLVYHMVALYVSLRLWGEHLFGENGSTYEVYV